jgi:hypothetical protein
VVGLDAGLLSVLLLAAASAPPADVNRRVAASQVILDVNGCFE